MLQNAAVMSQVYWPQAKSDILLSEFEGNMILVRRRHIQIISKKKKMGKSSGLSIHGRLTTQPDCMIRGKSVI